MSGIAARFSEQEYKQFTAIYPGAVQTFNDLALVEKVNNHDGTKDVIIHLEKIQTKILSEQQKISLHGKVYGELTRHQRGGHLGDARRKILIFMLAVMIIFAGMIALIAGRGRMIIFCEQIGICRRSTPEPTPIPTPTPTSLPSQTPAPSPTSTPVTEVRLDVELRDQSGAILPPMNETYFVLPGERIEIRIGIHGLERQQATVTYQPARGKIEPSQDQFLATYLAPKAPGTDIVTIKIMDKSRKNTFVAQTSLTIKAK